MIVSRLAGGLGNQIFQFAAVLILAKKNGINKIQIDDSALGNYDAKRENELLRFFNLNKLDIQIVSKNSIITKLRLPKLLSLSLEKYALVSDNNFQSILSNPNKNFMLVDGYFQESITQEDFDKEIELLKNMFVQSSFIKQNGCVIHIRGGDFVKLGWNSITPKEYYIKAIETMKNEYNQNKFYIVTDDREYSKIILDELNLDYEFIGNSMYEDFKLIGSFKYRILSASTFALWASVLGDNENSKVIAPKYWTPNLERKIYLPNEIRIEF